MRLFSVCDRSQRLLFENQSPLALSFPSSLKFIYVCCYIWYICWKGVLMHMQDMWFPVPWSAAIWCSKPSNLVFRVFLSHNSGNALSLSKSSTERGGRQTCLFSLVYQLWLAVRCYKGHSANLGDKYRLEQNASCCILRNKLSSEIELFTV